MTNLLVDLDGLRAGQLTTIRPLDEPMPWVDPRDIAAVATGRLLATDWTGRQVLVGMSAGFTPEQPRSALTTTPSSLSAGRPPTCGRSCSRRCRKP